ncbi:MULTISPECIES: siderophore ABC transporter substrate-binding protein [Actinomyces]|uniref:siderophore ABC transporter substrate-binding protein n=1 Tax=Actinomyces TaxID=1654 RepID=UPI001F15C877|nr:MULTISPECIES: ABC transporter substrate-binding protein [Actinomyces]
MAPRRHLAAPYLLTRRGALTGAGALGLAAALAACGSKKESGSQAASSASAADGSAAPSSVSIEDNHGTVKVSLPPATVVSTDNRTFEVLANWGVTLAAVPKKIIPSTITAYSGSDVVDLGNHREPDFDALIAAAPDLIIIGQRFTQHYDRVVKDNPEAAVIDLEPREGQPLDAELGREVTALGRIFNKTAEADKLIADFRSAIERAKGAYDASHKVMAVNVSGGNIGYVGPGKGRTWGPVFNLLGLTPALEVPGATNDHQGDDISVEAIAEANPDWILVLDRDAAIKANDPAYVPAKDVIAGNAALQSVTAVSKGQIVYAPADTYTNESIITYTEIVNSIADAFSGKAS